MECWRSQNRIKFRVVEGINLEGTDGEGKVGGGGTAGDKTTESGPGRGGGWTGIAAGNQAIKTVDGGRWIHLLCAAR